MHLRGTGRDHHTIQFPFFDIPLNHLLPGLGAHEEIVFGQDHIGLFGDEFYHFFHIDNPGYVGAAVANKDPNTGGSVGIHAVTPALLSFFLGMLMKLYFKPSSSSFAPRAQPKSWVKYQTGVLKSVPNLRL